jgi:Holliday junction resolvasome RuvABC endonuclease subunit
MNSKHKALVFGFHPVSKGFGWVAFSSPLTIYEWGVCYARGDKNASCLRRLEKLLSRFEPETIVLEALDQGSKRVPERILRLCRGVSHMAMERRIEVAPYSRKDVQACFASIGARSREEIAAAVARSYSVLGNELPKPRRPWDDPSHRLALFSAAAVVVTHYQLGASRLFNDLLHGD